VYNFPVQNIDAVYLQVLQVFKPEVAELWVEIIFLVGQAIFLNNTFFNHLLIFVDGGIQFYRQSLSVSVTITSLLRPC